MPKVENTLPETVVKYGALGVLGVGLFFLAEAAFSPAIAAALATGGFCIGLLGVGVWGVRQLPKLFGKK